MMLRPVESKPVRRKFTAVSEDAGVASTSNMTIVRVTPQTGPPLECVWSLRWVFVSINPIPSVRTSKQSIVFVGSPVPAMDMLAVGQNDLSKVWDAVDNLTFSTDSRSYDVGDIAILPGDALYVGMFGPGTGASIVVNAGVDEYRVPAVLRMST